MNTESFYLAYNAFWGSERQQNSIGTYSEKTLHAILKHSYELDTSCHEIKFCNFVADIMNDNGITEIQTRSLNNLRRKLDAFLPETVVTVVYPIASRKWLCWIDAETGETTKKRKSPKIGNIYDAVSELYKIKMYLGHPNFKLKLAFLEIEEYRHLNGWSKDKKRGSSRYERIPVAFTDEISFNCPDDYRLFLPDNLPENFTSQDFKKASDQNLKTCQTLINVLNYLGVIEQIGKSSRKNLYKIN
ncbi:MAG: hypothetical protein A2Y17_05555 [Clostridiales bacterium GWF2_38_85]|nr:MAG: hypothetical protein A2Y17_05555 [Clostridiales bacterium GWF2_38_85]HBL83309.1 hypothetical protein [Clostridiales bacterium]